LRNGDQHQIFPFPEWKDIDSGSERCPREGMLPQIDGSPHDWLEGRGPRLCLPGAIDDAAGKVPCALFQEQEITRSYLQML